MNFHKNEASLESLVIKDKGSREEGSLKSDPGAQTVLGALPSVARATSAMTMTAVSTTHNIFHNLVQILWARITFPLSSLKDLITVLHTGQSAFVWHHWTRHNKQKT